MEDFMPASENGVIADIHMTAFQSSIDEILATGRSVITYTIAFMLKTEIDRIHPLQF